MSDPTWRDSGGSQSLLMVTSPSQNIKDLIIPDPSPPLQRRSTVKEILMLRRQKRKCSEENNIPEHKFKSTKSEAFLKDSSPQHLAAPLAVNPDIPAYVPNAAPGNSLFMSQPLQHPSVLQERTVPTAEAKMTLFHWQIQQEAMKMEGVSPQQLTMQDADGDTFLHVAVAQGRRALAYVLAAKMGLSGSLNIKEHNGQTALHIAVVTNQHLIVSDLLVCGAEVNTQDLWGRCPLHVCVENGYFLCLQSICRTLTDTGQPLVVDMFNYEGLTPLHKAVLSHNAVVKDLQGVDKSTSCMAIERQVRRRRMYLECIKTLLHMGASCETKEHKSGRTCLHMAAEGANMELLHLFLEQPSSLSFVKRKTFSGNTALHIVCSLQNHKAQVEAVRLLMRKGADPGIRNCENELPSQLVPDGPTGDKVRQILKGKYVHA